MDQYVCIHGHFYQPPRENPWLETVETQDSAYPYHDWNQRVAEECYGPNSAARILDGHGRIAELVNNYASISFDFGPTLLAWLEAKTPDVYQAILDADQESKGRFSGHGSALAQPYNHVVMPLASDLDKRTQVMWGIRDFQHRFGRMPEGMWLPETALDLESLDIMAEMDVRFTVLAPHQALRVRPLAGGPWRDVSGGRIDSTAAYLLRLPSGREINLFFYQGGLSHDVAFKGLLNDGQEFARRLTSAFPDSVDRAQLVHIATDGESYGHHHKFGDMALAYAVRHIEVGGLARLTNYGEFLERCPPSQEVEVAEQTSWSCVHGIERWRADCGCAAGGHPGWNQSWRAPLRRALDWLRDTLGPVYEREAMSLLKDPWAARDGYIEVVLNRSRESVERFEARYAKHKLTLEERVAMLKLLELQRHAMLMYTSCGWFFDDLSRIETVQVLQYAARAMQLAQELSGDSLEPRFLDLLEEARSNLDSVGDGRRVYQDFVRPAVVGWQEAAGHYAVRSLFAPYDKGAKVYVFAVEREDYESWESGLAKLAVGRARFESGITQESAHVRFGVLLREDFTIHGGVQVEQDREGYDALVARARQTFAGGDLEKVQRLLQRRFGASPCSLRTLFRDEQDVIMDGILGPALAGLLPAYHQVLEGRARAMQLLAELGMPLPKPFQEAEDFFLNFAARRAVGEKSADLAHILNLVNEARTLGVELDSAGLGFLFQRKLEELLAGLVATPKGPAALAQMASAAEMAASLPFPVNLWRVRALYYRLLKSRPRAVQRRVRTQDADAREWLARFKGLGEVLGMRVA